MDSYHHNKIDQLEAKNSENHEWFPESASYNNVVGAKSSNTNIYDINENASNHEQDPIMQSASSIAANSLQTFVEEALRSVEDGVASLDHRALNMMVARQKETSEMPLSCSISNIAYLPPTSTVLSSVPTQPYASATVTSTNTPSTGLDLAQVVSEIFNDNTETADSECTNAQCCKTKSPFHMYHDSGGSVVKNTTSVTSISDNSMSTNYVTNSGILPVETSSVPLASPGRLVVSPSVLSKVLSKHSCFIPSNVYTSPVRGELDSTSPIIIPRTNIHDQEVSNLKCDHGTGEYTQHPPVRGLPQSSPQYVSPVCHAKEFDLFTTNNSTHSALHESFTPIDRFKLPQQPLPRSSLTDILDEKLPLTSQVSIIQNIMAENENLTKRNEQSSNISTSSFLHRPVGKNTLFV